MRLYHGDCLVVMDELIEQGVKVDAIITDPPYGTTACEWDAIIPFKTMWEKVKKINNNNTPFITFATEPFASLLRCSNLHEYKCDWIWDKEQGTNQFLKDKQPLRKHENICVFYKEQCTFNKVEIHSWRREVKFRQETNNQIVGYESKEKTSYDSKGLKHPVSILPFNRPHWREGRVHPTQKPIDLVQFLVQTYTNEGDTILDFTMGSGTTGIACINTNRKFIGIELDDNYFNIAKKRIDEYMTERGLNE
jgi:site-specific DNA-methyltransferase (adenine-specific)